MDNRLRYEIANDRILKKDYKSFLESIQKAVDALLQMHKQKVIDAQHLMIR